MSLRLFVAAGLGLVAATAALGSRWYMSARQESLALAVKEDVPPPGFPGLSYTGDALRYAKTSQVWPRLDAESRSALVVVANAGVFASRAVGVAGERPPSVAAFDRLLKSPLADRAFLELAQQGGPAARLYGLCGLRAKESPWLNPVAFDLASESTSVATMVDCTGRQEAVGNVAANAATRCGFILAGDGGQRWNSLRSVGGLGPRLEPRDGALD